MVFLGVFIFVDDYFNSFVVGFIFCLVIDCFYVLCVKFVYILDFIVVFMCVVMFVLSWGVYIMIIIGGILVLYGIEEYFVLGVYLCLVLMNFYVIFVLLMVFVVVWF